MKVLLIVLLCISCIHRTDSAATCSDPSSYTFIDTDILSTTTVMCVMDIDLSTYPDYTVAWSNLGTAISSTSNELLIHNIATLGNYQLMCNFIFDMSDPSNFTPCNINVTVYSLPTLTTTSSTTPITYASGVRITCIATGGFGTLSITWQWEDSSGSTISNDSDVLTFDNDESVIGDNKVFTCVATNEAGMDTTDITVTVKPNPPSVTLTPQFPTVFIGNTTTLTCTAASSEVTSQDFIYTWYVDGSSITIGENDVNINANVLTISDTRTVNSGDYSCSVTIYNSDPGMANTQLTVMSPRPLVSIEVDPNQTSFFETETLTLTCKVTPQPTDNTERVIISWSSTSGVLSMNNEILTFASLSTSDTGSVMCSATVGNSLVTSATFPLDVSDLPTLALETSNFTPFVGTTLTLTCGVDTSPQNIVWFKDTTIIAGENGITYTISNVVLDDTASYNCEASIQSSPVVSSNAVQIVVYQEPSITSQLPQFTFVTKGITPNISPLDCTATGAPPPSITWEDSMGQTYTNPLDLSNLTYQMNGTFTCIAISAAGNDNEMIDITIVPQAPNLMVNLSPPNPVLDREFTLECHVSNIPDGLTLSNYTFSWTGAPTPISVSTQMYNFTATESTNREVYTCTATVAGSSEGSASSGVLMLQRIPTLDSFDVPDVVYIGQSKSVSCAGNGIPDPTIVVTDTQDMTVSNSTGFVDLNSFIQSDDGTMETYTCYLSNEHDTISKSVTFLILEPTIEIVFSSDPVSVVSGKPFTLSCSVSTDPYISLDGTTYDFSLNETNLGSGSSGILRVEQYKETENPEFVCEIFIPNGELAAKQTLIVLPQIDPLILVAGGVSLVVLILLFALICLILIMLLCCLRQRKREMEPDHYPDYIGLENVTGSQQAAFSYPIQVATYSDTYDELSQDNQRKLKEQYSQLSTIKGNTEEARKAVNNLLNRYPDVLAYDHSRVIISKLKGTDYINANLMEGFRNEGNSYIAAQGPLGPPKPQTGTPSTSDSGAATPQLNTINDFWRMVWEHNISTIVMLTNLIEGNRIKCALYWPEDTQNYGRIRVRKIEENRFCDYVIRKFSIQRIQVRSNDGLTRQITQFHFVAWPDHGVPLFPIAMIQFVKLVRGYINQTEDGTNAPTLVHCSAGVGRTGTFICLDVILQQLAAGETIIDVWKETSRLRRRRNYMIQEYLQYEFVHQALNEYIQFGDTECSAADFPRMISRLQEITDENPYKVGMSRLELEFKKLQLRVIQTQHKDAKLNENAGKNRFINTMPFDSNRVKLNPLPGIVGSDYINASHIDSDKTHWAFIATQGPLKTTMEDFCRMLIEQNSNVIIMLSENSEDKTEDYFSYSQTHYGAYHLVVTKKHMVNDYIHREMTIKQDDIPGAHQVHHFQLTKPISPTHSQKDCGKALLSLITGVTVTLQPEETKKGPMVVHCGSGNGMTGVFMAVYIIIQRLAYEDKVDVFNTVKRLRMQRVAMVQSPDQYDLCYRTVMEYLQSSS